MTGDVIRRQLIRTNEIERIAVHYHTGTVTIASPLAVLLGGSLTALTTVKALASYSPRVNDVVAVVSFGNDMLVLGKIGTPDAIRGSVAADGSIVAGVGFTVNKTGTGLYTITFSVAMATRPAVVLTAQDTATQAASHASLANGALPTTAGFSVVTANAAATTTINVGFDFIAMAT